MKWARIENNVVREIVNHDPLNRYHQSLVWRSCGDDVSIGWVLSGDAFSAPAIDPAEQARIDKFMERLSGIEAAQAEEGLKEFTVQQARDHIIKVLTDAPNTIAGVKKAVGDLLVKIIPYVIS